MKHKMIWKRLWGAVLTAAMAVTALPATALAAAPAPVATEEAVPVAAEAVETMEAAAVAEPVAAVDDTAGTAESVALAVEEAVGPTDSVEETAEAAEEITIEADEEVVSEEAAYSGLANTKVQWEVMTRGTAKIERGAYIYMGTKSADYTWTDTCPTWIVLDPTMTNTGASGMFLLSKELIGAKDNTTYGGIYFNKDKSKGNDFQGSDAQAWCKTFLTKVLKGEQGAILATTKSDAAFSTSFYHGDKQYTVNYSASTSILNKDKIFFLSAEEVLKTAYGFSDSNPNESHTADYLTQGSARNWWLRSPNSDNTYTAGLVYGGGYVDGRVQGGYVNYGYAARPAFNFNLKSVIFSSAAEGGKSSGTTGAASLKRVDYGMFSGWKFTLLDDGSTDAAGSGHKNFMATKTSFDGSTMKISYSGAKTGTKEYVSAVVTDITGKTIKYYGRVAQNSASGTASIDLSDKYTSGDKLYVFAEQYNGDYATDYCSNLVELSFDKLIVPVNGVTLDKTTMSVSKGSTSQLTATVAPSNATNKNVSWASSDKSVATVSSSGLVTGVKAGNATITVKTKDGNETATCKVTVTVPATSVTVTLDKTEMSLGVGKTGQLTATVLPEDITNKNVTWSSSDESVATVSPSGLVTGVKAGTAIITVTYSFIDRNRVVKRTCTCTVTVTAASGGGETKTGTWKKNSKGWWYHRADGTYPKSQWEKIDGKWYYFDASGYMLTGWQKIGGKWYYLGTNGAMVTGWKQISGKWYYFNSSGAMQTGWVKISGKWYYFNSGGDMKTGWMKDGGKWYYLKSSGAMAVSESLTINGKTYHFDSKGVCTNP